MTILLKRPSAALWIFSLAIFLFVPQIEAANRWEILPAAPKIGRLDPVLAKTLNIRLAANAGMPAELQTVLNMPEITNVKRLLAPEQSLTFNSKLHSLDRIQRSGRSIAELMEAEAPLLRSFTISYTPDEIPEHYAQRLMMAFPEIEIAEPVYQPHFLMGDGTPNDPRIPDQELLETIRALEAWEIYDGDPDIVIGISDSGIFQQHMDLQGNLWKNPGETPFNGLDDDGNGYVDDWEGCNFASAVDGSTPGVTIGDGHGTAVAGIAGATANNDEGIVGTGNKCRIFPMKTQPNNGGPSFLWESVVYAANMGFDVLNCSWGSFSYSEINRAIISYCVSRDVAVVAGGGNHGDTRPHYPAGYAGVLGVGLTWDDDDVAEESAFGPNVRIMAPGQRALTTYNDNTYGRFDLTSSATPIVSGVVAQARGMHPDLSAVQALEFVRQCAVPILERNPEPEYAQILPNRVDMLNVMTRDPFSTPSITANYYELYDSDGQTSYAQAGRHTRLSIHLHNHLGAGQNLKFSLSIIGDVDNVLTVVNPTAEVAQFDSNSEMVFDELRFSQSGSSDADGVFFRIDISDGVDGGYRDFILLPFDPEYRSELRFTTFENNIVRFSMGDRGSIGFTGLTRAAPGVGFQYGADRPGSILFQGGLIVTDRDGHVSSTVKSADPSVASNEFGALFPWSDKTATSVVEDGGTNPNNYVGVQIRQKLRFQEADMSIVRLDLKILKTHLDQRYELAAGVYLDWDVGPRGADDLGELYSVDDIPGAPGAIGAIGIVENKAEYPVAVFGAFTFEEDAEAQMSIFNNDQTASGTPFGTYDGFSDEEVFRSLTSGTSLTYNDRGEIATVCGIRFPGVAPSGGDFVTMSVIFGAVDKIEDVDAAVERAVTGGPVSVGDRDQSPVEWTVSPQPAQGTAVVSGPPSAGAIHAEVVDLLGRPTGLRASAGPGATALRLDCGALPAGTYLLRLTSGAAVQGLPLVVGR